MGGVTAATNGTAIPVIKPLVINSGICTTASAAWATCNFTVTWPSAFADTNLCGNLHFAARHGFFRGAHWRICEQQDHHGL